MYDAQQPLEEKYKAQFDVVLCDPPDTVEAFALWMSRASFALRGANSALYMGLTSVYEWFEFFQQELSVAFFLLIESCLVGF